MVVITNGTNEWEFTCAQWAYIDETPPAGWTVVSNTCSIYSAQFFAPFASFDFGSGDGTVKSVGLILPSSTFEVTGSPVTETGDLNGAFIEQVAKTFLAGPLAGADAVPTWRIIAFTDFPQSGATIGQVLTWNGTAWIPDTVTSGSVTSVGLSLPASIFSVSGSPVTSSGTLAGALIGQAVNTVFAGPGSGGSATPTFRVLVAADIPNLDASKITTGVFAIARGGTGLSALGTALQYLRVNAAGTALEYATLTGLLPSGTSGQTLRHNGTAWIANSFLYNNGTSVGVGTAIGSGKFNVEFTGGIGSERVVEFTSSGGWGKRWINMFNTAGTLRGLQFGGETSGGGTTNNALSIISFPDPRVVINKDLTAYDAPYVFEVSGATDTNGLVVSRGSDPTLAAMLNINSDGDGILRSKSGFWTLGDLDVAISSQNPTAQLHLFAPSGASTDPVFAIEKSGGFGRTIFNQFYVAGGEWGTHITQAFASVDWMTFRTGGATYRVGVLNTNPTYNLDVTGTFRATSRTGTATALAGWASDGKSTDLGLSGLSIIAGVLTTTNNGTIGGTIAAGQIGYGSGANTLTSESDFTYDATNNRLAIATTSPTNNIQVTNATGGQLLRVEGSSAANGAQATIIASNASGTAGALLEINNAGTGDPYVRFAVAAQSWAFGIDNSNSDTLCIAADSGIASAIWMIIHPTTGFFAIAGQTLKTGISLAIGGTGGIMLPYGTTAQRPAFQNAIVRGNNEIGGMEYLNPKGTWNRITTTSAPVVTAGPGAGTGPTFVNANMSDGKGVINITIGTSPAAAGAVIFTVTYGQGYSETPVVNITPQNEFAVAKFYVSSYASGSFSVKAISTLTAGVTYSLSFIVKD